MNKLKALLSWDKYVNRHLSTFFEEAKIGRVIWCKKVVEEMETSIAIAKKLNTNTRPR